MKLILRRVFIATLKRQYGLYIYCYERFRSTTVLLRFDLFDGCYFPAELIISLSSGAILTDGYKVYAIKTETTVTRSKLSFGDVSNCGSCWGTNYKSDIHVGPKTNMDWRR